MFAGAVLVEDFCANASSTVSKVANAVVFWVIDAGWLPAAGYKERRLVLAGRHSRYSKGLEELHTSTPAYRLSSALTSGPGPSRVSTLSAHGSPSSRFGEVSQGPISSE